MDNLGGFQKKNVFAPKFHKFSTKFKHSPGEKMVSQAFWRSLRRNKIGQDLSPFSTSQKLVSSSSKGQGIFENCGLRGQGLQIVLKDSTSRNYWSSHKLFWLAHQLLLNANLQLNMVPVLQLFN